MKLKLRHRLDLKARSLALDALGHFIRWDTSYRFCLVADCAWPADSYDADAPLTPVGRVVDRLAQWLSRGSVSVVAVRRTV